MFSVDSEEERKSWVEAIEAVKEVCILHYNILSFTILHYTALLQDLARKQPSELEVANPMEDYELLKVGAG